MRQKAKQMKAIVYIMYFIWKPIRLISFASPSASRVLTYPCSGSVAAAAPSQIQDGQIQMPFTKPVAHVKPVSSTEYTNAIY